MLLKNAFKMREGALRRLFSPQESSALKQTFDLLPARGMPMQTTASDASANTSTLGGDGGLQVLVAYISGDGDMHHRAIVFGESVV